MMETFATFDEIVALLTEGFQILTIFGKIFWIIDRILNTPLL